MIKGNWKEFGDSLENSSAINKIENISSKSDKKVRVHRTRLGKGGKTVTIISGLNLIESELRDLLKKLKMKCGTGGTVKPEIIELQGDQVQLSIAILKQEGFSPKKSGG